MSDIMVIVVKEKNHRTGRIEEIVSHGINLDTDQTVIMSGCSPQSVGAVFDVELGEYVIRDKAVQN